MGNPTDQSWLPTTCNFIIMRPVTLEGGGDIKHDQDGTETHRGELEIPDLFASEVGELWRVLNERCAFILALRDGVECQYPVFIDETESPVNNKNIQLRTISGFS